MNDLSLNTSRRKVLGTVGVGVLMTIAGCLDSRIESGDVMIKNYTTGIQEYEIKIHRHSDTRSDIQYGTTPKQTELSKRNSISGVIEPDTDTVRKEIIEDPGVYWIQGVVSNINKGLWYRAGEAVNGGVVGGHIIMEIKYGPDIEFDIISQ